MGFPIKNILTIIIALGACPFSLTSAFTTSRTPITKPTLHSSGTRLEKKYHEARLKQESMRKTSSTALFNMPKGNIPIRIDQPLLAPELCRRSTSALWKCFFTVFVSDAFKTACLAFIIAFGISFFSKYVKSASKLPFPLSTIANCYKLVRGRAILFLERFKDKTEGVPMEFDPIVADGWGVCTLTSKMRVGRSKFMQYDFSLPQTNNMLNLALGQQLSMCCLDKRENVSKGEYYVFSDRNQLGTFSILAPDAINSSAQNKDIEIEVGKDSANFAKVLKLDLDIGDEVAIKPGIKSLEYKGQYLPVTDMVFFAAGSGIVPVLEQVKTVLPSGTSSVKSLSVIWVNKSERDFDAGMKTLEEEYFKYNTKLAVSCIVYDANKNKLEDNKEVTEALVDFKPGTMAVISGSNTFSEKARQFLIEKGYLKDCICALA